MLNIKITTNYILAFSCVHDKIRPYFAKYFHACIVLPTDIMEMCEFVPITNFFKSNQYK